MEGHGLDCSGLGQGQLAGACEYVNEFSGSVKCGEFLDNLRIGLLLKKDSVPWSELVMGEYAGFS